MAMKSRYIFTHRHFLTDSIEQSLSREADSRSAGQENPCFYGTVRFIPAFTRAYHRFYPETYEPSSHPTPNIFNIHLNTILRLPNSLLFFLFFNQNFVWLSRCLHSYYMYRPSRRPWFDRPNNILWTDIEENIDFSHNIRPPLPFWTKFLTQYLPMEW
jgi:hypothetical protein